MALWLRGHTALSEDQSSVPSTNFSWLTNHLKLHSRSSSLFWTLKAPALNMCAHTHTSPRIKNKECILKGKTNWQTKPQWALCRSPESCIPRRAGWTDTLCQSDGWERRLPNGETVFLSDLQVDAPIFFFSSSVSANDLPWCIFQPVFSVVA